MGEQAPSAEVVLRLKDVCCAYASKTILSDVNLEIRRREMFFVVGDSGSGKTTLLRVCAGLLAPTSGVVELRAAKEGKDMAGLDAAIGFVFQQQGLISNLTVFENVALPLRYHTHMDEESIRRRVEDALRSAGAIEAKAIRPDYLSLGMQRRVGVARAIVVQPDIIFYDDPILGLDHMNATAIARLIKKTRDDHGVTSVVVTHSLVLACAMGDRIAVVIKGRVRDVGSPDQLRNSADPETKDFFETHASLQVEGRKYAHTSSS